jgi:hypothetical protein
MEERSWSFLREPGYGLRFAPSPYFGPQQPFFFFFFFFFFFPGRTSDSEGSFPESILDVDSAVLYEYKFYLLHKPSLDSVVYPVYWRPCGMSPAGRVVNPRTTPRMRSNYWCPFRRMRNNFRGLRGPISTFGNRSCRNRPAGFDLRAHQE